MVAICRGASYFTLFKKDVYLTAILNLLKHSHNNPLWEINSDTMNLPLQPPLKIKSNGIKLTQFKLG